MNIKYFFGITLALVMLASSVPYSFADDTYISPRKQLESGIAPEDVQCKDNRVLVLRTNGSPACVTEKTAERTGWEIIIKPLVVKVAYVSSENIIIQDSLVEEETIESIILQEPKVTVLDYSSPTAFVDDGREYPEFHQRSAPPQDMYDRIMESKRTFDVDNNGVATFNAVPHEKYSLNEGVGHYVEDWLPTFVPKGQQLLYAETSYSTFDVNGKTHERYGTGITFVPTNFVLSPDVTTRDLKNSKGISIGIAYSTLPHDEVEDSIELIKEGIYNRSDSYGGFREMTRDGKTVMAVEGGNGINPYQAVITFYPDEFSRVTVSSHYHTLDELIPIFNNVMK